MAVLAGCKGILGFAPGSLSDGSLGQPCDIESNDKPTPCASGFACVQNVCQTQCHADSDCGEHERCLSGDSSPSGLSSVGGCVAANDPCSASCNLGNPGNWVTGTRACGPDGGCRNACNANAPAQSGGCFTDQTCQGTDPGCPPHPGSCPGVCYGSPPHDQSGSNAGDGSAAEGSTQGNSDAEVTDAPPADTSIINVPTCSCPNGTPGGCASCPPAIALAVDGDNVFWTTNWSPINSASSANVLRCPVSGCGAGPTSLGTFQNDSPELYVNAGDVYWATVLFTENPPSTVNVCTGGTCASPTVLSSPVYYDAQLLGVNASGLYFMDVGPDNLVACPLSGCGADGGAASVALPQSVFFNSNLPLAGGAYALDAQNLYWYRSSAGGVTAEIDSCPLSGCPVSSAGDGGYAPNVLATFQQGVTAMAVDAQHNVFWSVQGSGSAVENNYDIVACPVAGCAGNPTVLAANQVVPSLIVVDGATLYWFNRNVGDIWSCATGGCNSSPKFVAHTGSGTAAIAFDASYLYWVSGQGFVARAPKPM